VCGSFFCSDCLNPHEGNFYCPKHYKGIAAGIKKEQERDAARQRHGRHHLQVHYMNNHLLQGTCRSLNLKDTGFFLEIEDDSGKSLNESARVQFSEIKMVCNVKSYDGKFDPKQDYPEFTPGGNHIIVKFTDGEIAEGRTLHAYTPDTARFYLIPNDVHSNNINMLIERHAVQKVYTPEQFLAERREQKKQQEESKPSEPAQEDVELGQDESMGDFYFQTHDYENALSQYEQAAAGFPQSVRLNKKIVVSLINIGIQFIKSRQYPIALEYMDKALTRDPNNPHAKKKTKQLRKIIEKTQRQMREYHEQRSKQNL
jgi:tetratricopeptide (TPR) repeat protein